MTIMKDAFPTTAARIAKMARPRRTPWRRPVDADAAPHHPTDTLALPTLDAPSGHGRDAEAFAPSNQQQPPPPASALPLHIALSALAGLVATIVWAITGGGYYWTAWVWLGLGIPVAIHAIIRFGLSQRASARHGLALHGMVTGLISAILVIIWGFTTSGVRGFWPLWPLLVLGVAVAVAIHAIIRFGLSAPTSARHGLALHMMVTGLIGGILLVVWGFTTNDVHAFWPLWPLLILGVAVAVHALVIYAERLPGVRRREAQLEERVGELTRTRQGALDVQAAELRRIERDLHDGAQARLVALSLLLGRTEERLGDRPEEAELVRRARAEASAAIGELRDLARGIAPPVLADRGLAAAVEALGRRAVTPVTVDAGELESRPLPVVETAAYFVVAEALTNVAKHAAGAPAHIRLSEEDGRLLIEIADEGPGGAIADGSGLSGLRARVEALDGTLTITSVKGSGTTVHAELPCGR
jgi:signal transduction histidine kinase